MHIYVYAAACNACIFLFYFNQPPIKILMLLNGGKARGATPGRFMERAHQAPSAPAVQPQATYTRAMARKYLWLNGEHAVQHLTLALIPLGTYYILYTVFYIYMCCAPWCVLKYDPPSRAPRMWAREKF